MALPKFLDKAALSASEILQNFDRNKFEEILLSHTIGIAYDDNALGPEGKNTLDLVIRLIARLYPKIGLYHLTKKNEKITSELIQLATSINPLIEISSKIKPTVNLVIGKTKINSKAPTFYIGSKGWVSHFSIN